MNKLLLLVIGIIGSSIVIFNNTVQLLQVLSGYFYLWTLLLLIILVNLIYGIKQLNDLKKK